MSGIPACKQDAFGVTLQVGKVLLKCIPTKGIDILQAFCMNKDPVAPFQFFFNTLISSNADDPSKSPSVSNASFYCFDGQRF
jgi:hypothetical protein